MDNHKSNQHKRIKQPVRNGVAKVPMVMQLEFLECGAASLAMVLAYYDKWLPLEQVRADCGVSRDGSNAKNILLAARSYGLVAKGYYFEPKALKSDGKFPCIIHWNFNHFVVLNGFKGDKAVINDPARGTCSVSMETFDESFTGICLMFEPDENFTPSGKPKSVAAFAKERLKGTGTAIAFVVLTGIITSLFGVINPAFSRIFLDRLLTGQNPEWFIPFLIALSGFTIIQLIAAWIGCIYNFKINAKMDAVGTSTFTWQILRMPMEFFSQRMAGDIQLRQHSNAEVAGNLVNTLAPLLLQSVMVIFYLVVMLRYSLLLTLVGLISVAINIAIARIISKKRINISRVQMRDAGKLAGATVAGIEMIETIKANGAENGYFEKWAGYQAGVNTQKIKFTKLDQYLGMVPTLVSSLTNTAILMLGVYLIIEGQFTVGMVMAFQGFLTSFTAPVTKLIEAGQTLQELRTTMERIDDVMKHPIDESLERTQISEIDSYDKLSGDIEIKDISFGYFRLGQPLIKDFSLSVKQGQKIAFVGGSGCGKSTLAKLISGLYKPWSGEILFDGKSLEEIDRDVLTGSLVVVDQDIVLFEDTIANNIKMWDNSIEDFEMILAARDAQIHEDIMQREGGYQHKLIEGGRDFSGGQRQRIEISRALAQNPTIVILDEATSALDARTEYNVVKSITDRGITCILVAHRLSTIRDCDEIIVMDYGEVVERGTHDELMSKGGKYAELIAND